MAEKIEIQIEMVTKEAIASIKKFTDESEKRLKGVKDNTDKIGSAFEGISGVVKIAGAAIISAFAGRAIINGFKEVVEKATEFENSLIGLSSVASSFGVNSQLVTEKVRALASDGLVPVKDIAGSLKNLLATGLNLQESADLFLVLKDSAAFGRQGFLSLGTAIEGATQGIKNGQSTLVDNAGITKNLSVLQKEYAASIGTTIGKLSEAQKIQAIYTGILREGSIFAGDAAKLTQTYSGSLAKLDFVVNDLLVTIGKYITKSPQMISLINIASVSIGNLTKFIQENNEQISSGIRQAIIVFVNSLAFGLKGLDNFVRGVMAIPDIIKLAFANVASIIMEPFVIAEKGINKLLDRFEMAGFQVNRFSESLDLANTKSEELAKTISKIGQDKTFLGSASAGLAEISKALNEIEDKKVSIEKVKPPRIVLPDTSDLSSETNLRFMQESRRQVADISKKISGDLAKADIFSSISTMTGQDTDRTKEINSLKLQLKDADILPFDKKKIQADIVGLEESMSTSATAGLLAGVANAVVGGREGARKMVAGLGKAAANMIVPGLGEAVGPLLEVFSQGPDAVKAMVKDFTDALPMIIENIITSIPVFIEALADAAPLIIERIVDRLDEIVIALANAMPRVALKLSLALAFAIPFALAKSLPQALINIFKELASNIIPILKEVFGKILETFIKIPALILNAGFQFAANIGRGALVFVWEILRGAGEFVGEIIKGAGKFVNELISKIPVIGGAAGGLLGGIGGIIGGIGGAIGGAVESVGRIFGFAKGGMVNRVPSGFPNDSFPARLSSGELVVDRSTTADLQNFLDNRFNGNSNRESDNLMLALLTDISQSLRADQNISTNVEFNDSTLANIILKLSRNNARVA